MTEKRKTTRIVLVALLILSILLTIILSDNGNVIKTFLEVFIVSEAVGVFVVGGVQIFVINPIVEELQNAKRTAGQDVLTGIGNRNSFIERTPFYNDCKSIGILFIDVNDLKKTNDTYGHEAGDELICSVAKTIKNLEGVNDCYRFGGDEFVIVLPNATLQQLEKVQKDLSNKIAQLQLNLSPNKCSVAIGSGYKDFDINVESLIKKADTDMYQQKKKQKAAKR